MSEPNVLRTYQVRTTHGKTRLRAKRSFGPVPVSVELSEADAVLVLADPFLEAVLVEEAVHAEPEPVEAPVKSAKKAKV